MIQRPALETERFGLWHPSPDDLSDLCKLHDDPETLRHLGSATADPKSQFERMVRHAGGWSLFGYGMFYVRPKDAGEIIAVCGVFHSWRGFGKGMDDVAEAGWTVRRDWCGRGVAREAMEAALAWFEQEHGARRIGCMIEEGNIASERLAARLGFVRYGEHTLADRGTLIRLFERLPAPLSPCESPGLSTGAC